MIGKIFAELHKAYGDQQWWLVYTPFEMMIAALLAQHASQSYSKKALVQLKQHDLLTPEALSTANKDQLEICINVVGENGLNIHVDQKIQQLQYFSQWYCQQGGVEKLNALDMLELRNVLLALDGMDKETADLILLYAFERPVFIIDEDTRRIFYRLELINGDEPHDELRHIMALSLDQDAVLFNEYHALLAHHAKVHCRYEAQCEGCPLDKICPE